MCTGVGGSSHSLGMHCTKPKDPNRTSSTTRRCSASILFCLCMLAALLLLPEPLAVAASAAGPRKRYHGDPHELINELSENMHPLIVYLRIARVSRQKRWNWAKTGQGKSKLCLLSLRMN